MSRRRSIAMVTLLVVSVAACDGGSSGDSSETTEPSASVTESIPDDDQAAATTVLDSIPSVDSATESDPPASWTAASSLTGELTHIVSWSEGFAAIMRSDGDEPGWGEGGELWYSADGVEWDAAVVRPFGRTDDIYSLVGQNDQLFALSGDISDYEDGSPQTLWRRRSGEPWEEVMTDDALHRIAANSERLIAYRWDPFGILAVFETATMAPVEFGWSDGALVDQRMYGDVMALDEGFLATARWPTNLDADADPILLYSADGSAWEQHPSPPPGGVGSTWGQATVPTFDGRNLVPSFSLSHPPRGGAWVTDTGVTFEPLPDPVTDDVINPAPAAYLVELTTGNDAGFFGVEDGVIYRSLDGLDWTTLESPPTWPVLADSGKRGLAHGTILTTDDSLIAVGVHGDFEGWVGLVDPSTEVWTTQR